MCKKMKVDKSMKSREKNSPKSKHLLSKKFSRKKRNNNQAGLLSTSRAKRKSLLWPWVVNDYSPGMVGLHEEIKDFFEYMQPTIEEKSMRENVVNRVKEVVAQLWPMAKVELFGSYPTDLYLPTSDIDIVLFGEWKYLPLFTLHEELVKHGLADKSTSRVIEHSIVPIVKFQDIETHINVDISFNKSNGLEGVKVIKNYIQRFPVLPKLMHVLKHFLYMRDLNEVFTGGLGSYALFMLCVSFLQLHPRRDATYPNVNLGVLLIEFFELYGRCFNYELTCIRIKNGGSYINKQEFHLRANLYSSSILSIEDPVTEGNDLCKGSYAMIQIQHAFDYAYRSLTTAMCKEDYNAKQRSTYSYLGYIVNVHPSDSKKRAMMCQKWKESRDNTFLKRDNEASKNENQSSSEPRAKKSKLEIDHEVTPEAIKFNDRRN